MKNLWFFTAVVFPVLFEVSHQCSSSSYDENEVTPINCKYFYQSWTCTLLSKLFVVLFCTGWVRSWIQELKKLSKRLPPQNFKSKSFSGTLVGPKCQDTLGAHLEVVCMGLHSAWACTGLHESLVFSRGQIFIKIIHPKYSKFPFSWTWN